MALPPTKFREVVLQLLYAAETSSIEDFNTISWLMEILEISKKNIILAREKAHQIIASVAEIDALLAPLLTAYDLSRIQIVTRNILRLGIFEILFEKILSPKIVISEAIRLSRKFSNPESSSIVNAILHRFYETQYGKSPENHDE